MWLQLVYLFFRFSLSFRWHFSAAVAAIVVAVRLFFRLVFEIRFLFFFARPEKRKKDLIGETVVAQAASTKDLQELKNAAEGLSVNNKTKK